MTTNDIDSEREVELPITEESERSNVDSDAKSVAKSVAGTLFFIFYFASMPMIFIPGLGRLSYLGLSFCFPDVSISKQPEVFSGVIGLGLWLYLHFMLGALWGRYSPRNWKLASILPLFGPLSVSLAMVQIGMLLGGATLSPLRVIVLMTITGGLAYAGARLAVSRKRASL